MTMGSDCRRSEYNFFFAITILTMDLDFKSDRSIQYSSMQQVEEILQ